MKQQKGNCYLRNADYHRSLWLHLSMIESSLTCWMVAEDMEIDMFEMDAGEILLNARQQKILEEQLPCNLVDKLRMDVKPLKPTFWQQQLGEYYDGIAQQSHDIGKSRK